MLTTEIRVQYLEKRGIEVISSGEKTITVINYVAKLDEIGRIFFEKKEITILNNMKSIRKFLKTAIILVTAIPILRDENTGEPL